MICQPCNHACNQGRGCPRVSELRNTRKIYDTGERRKNVSGKSATVWAIIKGDNANV